MTQTPLWQLKQALRLLQMQIDELEARKARLLKTIEHQDNRVAMERLGGKLLDLVAA